MIEDRDVRAMLRRRADAISAVPTDPVKAVKKARRRITVTAVSTVVTVLVFAVVAIDRVDALQDRRVPLIEPTPTTQTSTAPYQRDRTTAVLIEVETGEVGQLPSAIRSIRGAQSFQVDPVSGRWTFSDGTYLYVTDPGGERPRRLPYEPYGQVPQYSSEGARTPRWSPDGTKIVFAATAGVDADVFVIDPATGDTTQLTHDLRWENSLPSFTPDGASVVFTASIGDRFGLWTVPATGGAPTLLLGRAAYGAFAPNDDRLVYWQASYHRSMGDLHMADVMIRDGDARETLVDRGGVGPMVSSIQWETARPIWSPDGSRVVLEELDPSGIIVVDAATGHQTKMGSGSEPTWFDEDTLIIEGYGSRSWP